LGGRWNGGKSDGREKIWFLCWREFWWTRREERERRGCCWRREQDGWLDRDEVHIEKGGKGEKE